jgi:hypothetical protein
MIELEELRVADDCTAARRCGDRAMRQFVTDLIEEPSPGRYARVGATVVGGAGAIVGLVVGLHVYAATAWFAMFEIGVPAAIAGGAVGAVLGCAGVVVNRHGWGRH